MAATTRKRLPRPRSARAVNRATGIASRHATADPVAVGTDARYSLVTATAQKRPAAAEKVDEPNTRSARATGAAAVLVAASP